MPAQPFHSIYKYAPIPRTHLTINFTANKRAEFNILARSCTRASYRRRGEGAHAQVGGRDPKQKVGQMSCAIFTFHFLSSVRSHCGPESISTPIEK